MYVFLFACSALNPRAARSCLADNGVSVTSSSSPENTPERPAETTGPAEHPGLIRTMPTQASPFDLRVDILGVHVSVTDLDDAVRHIERWIAARDREYICVADVNSLLHAGKDPNLRAFYNRSGLTLPDGMPLVWAGRSAGFRQISRVCGPDLLPRVMQASLEPGWKHYLLGGAEGVAQRLADLMLAKFPDLQIVGVECPPFHELSESEKREQVERLNASGADIVWIGLGAPKQERWMAEFRPSLDAAVLIGVGAAFNIHSGDVKRAPLVLQRAGFEWAFRLTQEPRRLWKRYVFGIPTYMGGLLKHRPKAVSGRHGQLLDDSPELAHSLSA